MNWRLRYRPPGGAAVKHKRYAEKLGAELHASTLRNGVRNGIYDGYAFRARKAVGWVTVDAVEIPGRFVGSNQYRPVLDPLEGESTIDGIVVSTAPSREAMSPFTAPVVEVQPEQRPGQVGTVQAFGTPLPENPFLLYNSFPTEFDGGVIFVHLYTDIAPPPDGSGGYVVTDQPVWLAVLVRWAGAGSQRSVSFHEDYVKQATGMGFYPRHVVYQGAPLLPIRYGARLPVAHYHAGRLSVAMELQVAAGAVSTVGGLWAVGVSYPDNLAEIEWQHLVAPDSLGPDLQSDTFDGDAGQFQAAGFDLPAVFSWVDGEDPVTLVSFRARARKAVAGSYRLTTGQALLTVVDGAAGLQVDYVDSIAGLDAGLPQEEAGKVLLQKYRDDFFLDAEQRPVRHRRMRVMVRPTNDATISASAPTSLAIHTDLARLVTQGAAGIVTQTQAALGYGPEEQTAGTVIGNGGNGVENIGFSTPVAVGEVWTWGFLNGTGAQRVAIARLTASGVAAPLANLPRSLRLSTYQHEVKDQEGDVVVPMAQVATVLDNEAPFIAVKKGRLGALAFLPAASFSRFGTFYLASPATIPRYGSMYE